MNKIAVEITSTLFVEQNQLEMYNIDTGEVKTRNQIDASDPSWILHDSVQAFKVADEIEHESIKFEEIC